MGDQAAYIEINCPSPLQSRGLGLATINLITKDNPKPAYALN